MTQKTKDYEKFTLLDFNRDVDSRHVKKLKDSISKFGYLHSNPIIVNSGFEIIDGQHRFVACKEMGLPIEYEVIVDANDSIMIDLNNTAKGWTINNFINHYARKTKNQNYLRLQRLVSTTSLGPSVILGLAKGTTCGGTDSSAIRLGTLKFSLDDELRVTSYLKKVEKISKLLKQKVTGKFCSGLITLSKYKGFKWDTLESKALKYPTMAYPCRTAEEYAMMFKDLYNYGTRKAENRI